MIQNNSNGWRKLSFCIWFERVFICYFNFNFTKNFMLMCWVFCANVQSKLRRRGLVIVYIMTGAHQLDVEVKLWPLTQWRVADEALWNIETPTLVPSLKQRWKWDSLIDRIASSNGYGQKNGFSNLTHSHTPNLEMLSHLKSISKFCFITFDM